MFSTLLSRPKNSEYDPSYHFILSRNIQFNVRSTSDASVSKYDKTIPLKKRYPDLVHNFPKPEPNEELINETKEIFDKLLNSTDEQTMESDTNYINYSNEEGEKIIQVKTFQVDPMLPPSHKLRKNRHERIVDKDLTIVKDTNNTRITKEDRQYWNIPAAVSNWKNSQGFTIGLDKRMIGREKIDADMNIEKFGELSEALNVADKQAREDIKQRNELRQQEQLNEKRLRDEKIKLFANRNNNKRRKY